MSNYQVGQKVRVRPDLNAKKHNYSPMLTGIMLNMKGKIVTIADIPNAWAQNYRIKEDNKEYSWHPSWFVPIHISKEDAFEQYVRGEIDERTYQNVTEES